MDVASWLRDLGLERYEATFRENDVGPELLPTLTADDLKEIGVTSFGHRRHLLEAIAKLRSDAPSQETVRSTDDRPGVDLNRRAPPAHRDVLRPGGFDGAE